MGIWDNETLAKLRAMKNKMLGLDEKNIDSGIEKDKERGEPLSKITRTYKVEKVIKGKRYIEERTEEKVEPTERHKRRIEKEIVKNINKKQKIRIFLYLMQMVCNKILQYLMVKLIYALVWILVLQQQRR